VTEPEGIGEDRPQWTVWRQDDNGHRFVVAHHADRESAETQVAEMQARGHKQLYWVEVRK